MRTNSVLIVDDEPAILRALGRTLQLPNARFRFAAGGEEALQLIAQELPDLLVADQHMPGMSGLELVRRVLKEHPGVRCALHTADPPSREAFPEGVVTLAKPMSPEEFAGWIGALLR